MNEINVAVIGARGRMGRAVCAAVEGAGDMRLVATLDAGDQITPETLGGADVAVDFTVPGVTEANVHALVDAGVHAVVGTSGWTEAALGSVHEHVLAAPRPVGVLVAPNFALGAVLAMHFAEKAARYFESVEIVELHHPDKVDAPSGTAVHTAKSIAAARAAAGLGPLPDATEQSMPGARGASVEGVPVHSVRLRGLTAHEEIFFGNPGEQLTIRTDSFDRSSFMPGVLLAVRGVGRLGGLRVGLEHLLDL